VEERVAWQNLPAQVRAAIQARTGPITAVRTPGTGQNSPLAAIVTTDGGTVFAKGMPSAHRRVITQAREAATAPLVPHLSPALLWHFDEGGWNVLGYEYVEGRHADYRSGSPDLDLLVALMTDLGQISVPDHDGTFKRAEDRWRTYVSEPGHADLFAGDILTHSDWTPDNVLVSADRAWLIDWAWPTLGAAWTDPACWILRLMASGGHTAQQAEQQAARLPAFANADPDHVDAFALANVTMWEEIARQSALSWTKTMAQAATEWAAYRQARGNA
jgi:hypothetical protein